MLSFKTIIAYYSQTLISITYSLSLTFLNDKLDGFKHIYLLIFIYFITEIPFLVYTLIKHKPKSTSIDDINQISSFINNDSSHGLDNNEEHDEDTTQKDITKQSNVHIGMKCISFALPAFFDFLSKVCIYNGLLFIKHHNTILQPLISIVVSSVVTFFFEKHNKISKRPIIACLYLLGFVLVLLSFMFGHFERNSFTSDYAMYLVLIGEGCKLVHFYIQDQFIQKGEQISVKQVGFEGMFGLLYSGVLVIAMCLTNEDTFMINGSKVFYIGEKIESISSDIKGQKYMYFVIICLGISFAFYNVLGLNVIRKTNSVFSKVLLDNLKIIPIVIYYYLNENINDDKKIIVWALCVVGFVIMIIASNLACEIIVIFNIGRNNNSFIDSKINNMNKKDNFLYRE